VSWFQLKIFFMNPLPLAGDFLSGKMAATRRACATLGVKPLDGSNLFQNTLK
jgi:hypothetical protein